MDYATVGDAAGAVEVRNATPPRIGPSRGGTRPRLEHCLCISRAAQRALVG
ncbi:hypothetical protein ACFZBU_46015 [Embleya sp. NPDC008237]|uniref:hypothetical protein n=1 Tax=Embleya sp. NPDC008237 TaxID=3363978 RepID=UPI0036F0E802